MSRVGRLSGAILVETGGRYFLVGTLKRPCDFPAAGFETPPVEMDPVAGTYLRLDRSGPLRVPGPWLELALEGEALVQAIGARLLIERNGSVSDRLWRLILSPDPDAEVDPAAVIDARWLAEMPAHLWRIVREAVLKCV
jgi:hypothetical protein